MTEVKSYTYYAASGGRITVTEEGAFEVWKANPNGALERVAYMTGCIGTVDDAARLSAIVAGMCGVVETQEARAVAPAVTAALC